MQKHRQTICFFCLCCLLSAGCSDSAESSAGIETSVLPKQTTAVIASETEASEHSEPGSAADEPVFAEIGDNADPEKTAPVMTAAPPLRGTDPYYALRGTVTTIKDNLLLRKDAGTLTGYEGSTNVITSMKRGEQVTILAQTYSLFDPQCTNWYLVDYDGAIGYAAAEFIMPGSVQCAVTDRELLAIAQCLYLNAMTAEAWEYTNCFLFDTGGQRLSDPYQNHENYVPQYMPLRNDTGAVAGKDGFLNQIHSFFAPKYDSMRYRGNLGSLTDVKTGCYILYNDRWYLDDAVFNKGALLQGAVSEAPHQIIRLKQTNSGSTELHFSGTLDFSQTEYAQEGWSDIRIDDFSICFEGGRFKVGYYHNPSTGSDADM